ncbi:FadR family transcriptional regulator [bacterium LRH843]|nr:FadR family transcriptional regulator [bacterium LRH843]
MAINKELTLKAVKRKSLTKQVIERILKLLEEGQLRPGDKLPTEAELLENLNVSRPVLREALVALDLLGVVTNRQRDGIYINGKIGSNPFSAMLSLTADNSPAIVEARMVLELGLVTIAAEKITNNQLKMLKETIDIIAKNTDNDFGETDREFHKIIALSANNPVVEGMIESLLLTHQKTDLHIKVRERDITVQHHIAIYNALAKRDPYEAYTEMYRHLDYVRYKVFHEWNANKN